MILSYVESLIPPLIPIPGVKIGLANIAVVFALYTLGWRSAFVISLVRVILSSLLFGSTVSMAYSAAGAVLSLSVMLLLMRVGVFSEVGVSVAGGVMHNVGQILMASLILESYGIWSFILPLMISGTLAGTAIGAVSALLVKKTEKYIKIQRK